MLCTFILYAHTHKKYRNERNEHQPTTLPLFSEECLETTIQVMVWNETDTVVEKANKDAFTEANVGRMQ